MRNKGEHNNQQRTIATSEMNVCMITFGSAVDYSIALTQALSKYCSVDFYVSDYHLKKGDPSILDVLREKARVFRYGNYRHLDIRNIGVYHRLFKKIAARSYDVLHLQVFGTPWTILPWSLFCSDLPLVMTVHDPYPNPGLSLGQRIYDDVMQYVFVNRAKRIIVHSQLLKKHILERYPRKTPQNIHVLNHGDFSIMKHWDTGCNHRDSKHKIILFFGDVRRNKGLEYLLKAEPIIRESLENYEIVIAGKCNEWPRYEAFLTSDAKVTVVNKFIPNEDVAKYFRRASVVVLPYLSATQSGIIPLAYTFGRPVVATQVGAIPEVVRNGLTGLLVKPADEKALAEAIIRLLRDDNMAKTMGENALRFSEKNLSWDSIAEKTLRLYSELVHERSVHY